MSVYVVNLRNQPLMPCSPRKARLLLKEKKAKVVKRNPFTIQLLCATGESKQDLTLGIDSGYLNIGFSVVSEKEEVLSGEVKLLQGMKERLKDKAQYRRIRRQRLRYRKPRWQNRKKEEGWLAPSIQHKLDSHLRFFDRLHEILPITKTIVEVANFDIQKIKNPEIEGKQYQEGEQLGFWNVREYIFHRDGHECQNPSCKNKMKQPILQVHHIIFQSNGGTDSPNNLITLCTECHTSENHKGFLKNWKPKIKSFRDATFMSIMRWYLVNELKNRSKDVHFTYGYLTKSKRIGLGLPKSHYNDAFCIADGSNQIRKNHLYLVEQTKRNNRSLEKFYDSKYIDVRDGEKKSGSELNCGRRTRNKEKNNESLRKYRGEKVSCGRRSIRKERYSLQPKDLVKYENQLYEVMGVQNKGQYVKLGGLKKVPRMDLVQLISYGKGLRWSTQT